MLELDVLAMVMSAQRDQIHAVMRDHEAQTHQGHACWGNRCAAVAFIAHCLGVRANDDELWGFVRTLAKEYDETCKSNDCAHGEE